MKRICGGDAKTCQGGRGTQEKFGERDSQPLTNEEMLPGWGERRPGTPGPQTHAGQPGTRHHSSGQPILDEIQRRKPLLLIPRAAPAQRALDSWPSQPKLLLAHTSQTAGGRATPVRVGVLPSDTCRGHRDRLASGSHQHTLQRSE